MATNFGFDAGKYLEERKPTSPFETRDRKDLADVSIGSDLIGKSKTAIESMLKGEIPQDVQDQIERTAAEKSLSQGIGLGQKSRNLVARDLGLASIDIVSQGIQGAQAIGSLEQGAQIAQEELNTNRQQFNEQSNMALMEFNSGLAQWEDNFANTMAGTDLTNTQIELMGAELISKNQQFVQTLLGNLVIANSQRGISGLSDYVNNLNNYFTPTDRAIRDIAEI